MRKMIVSCFALALLGALIGGCKVEGEVDPDGHVTSNVALPQ